MGREDAHGSVRLSIELDSIRGVSNLNNSIILCHFRIFAQHNVLSFNYNPARPI